MTAPRIPQTPPATGDITPAGFELVLAKQANEAMAKGANPHATTELLGQMIRHLRANPDLAKHASEALAQGADPNAVTGHLWDIMQQPAGKQDGQQSGNIDLRQPAESTGVSPARPPSASAGPGVGVAGLSGAVQGLTSNFGDELEGAMGAIAQIPDKGGLRNFGKNYQASRDDARRQNTAASQAHPVAYGAGQLAGAVAPVLATGGASLAPKGAGLLLRAGAGAAEGALLGGAAGTGASEGKTVSDVAKDAAKGGGAGLLIGGALPLAGAAVKGTGRVLLDASGLRSASAPERATGKILEALQRDQTTPQMLRAAAQDAGGKPVSLVDLAGENTVGLARAAQAVPSKAKQLVKQGLMDRQAGQFGRVGDDLETAVGQGRANVYDVADQLLQHRRTAAQPLYEAAYAKSGVSDPTITEALSVPAFQKAYQRGQRIAKLEGVELPSLKQLTATSQGGVDPAFLAEQGYTPEQVTAFMQQAGKSGNRPDNAPQVPVQAIDYMKRGLDDVIQSGFAKGSLGKTEARALRSRLGDVLDVVDKNVPEYAAARAQYAGDSAMHDALTAGQEFLKQDSRVTAKALARLTPGEQQLFRVGALDAIRKSMDNATEGTDLTSRIFGTPEKQAQLEALFGKGTTYTKLEKALRLEGKMSSTKNQVLGNSVTARAQSEIEDLQQPAGRKLVKDAAMRGPIKALLSRALDEVETRGRGVAGKVADELSGKLTAGAVPGTSLKDVLDELERLPGLKRDGPIGTALRQALSSRAGAAAGSPQ